MIIVGAVEVVKIVLVLVEENPEDEINKRCEEQANRISKIFWEAIWFTKRRPLKLICK